MKAHYPGSVFTLINQSNEIYLDTYLPNTVPFSGQSASEQNAELKTQRPISGLRGIAIDDEYGLIFVCAEILGKILVFDMDSNFTNTFNITFGSDVVTPISVISGGPYFPSTLFVTDRAHNDGVYGIRYTKSDYHIWWKAEKVPELQHATGIAIAADSLFVVAQGTHSILRYSPYSGHYFGRIVHFENSNPSGIISHKGIGKVGDPVERRRTLGEQLLYIPTGKMCAVN